MAAVWGLHASAPLQQPLPGGWHSDDAVNSASPLRAPWWHSFNSPLLDSLITRALDANYDLRTAALRIAQSRAAAGQTRSQWYPTVGLDGQWSRQKTLAPAATSAFSLEATLAWEVDLFGRIASQVKEQNAQTAIAEADRDAMMLTVSAEVASNFISLCQAHSELNVAREHLASQKRVVDIARARHEAGLVSELDVAQAQTVYYTTQAEIPALEATMRTSANAIALLMGEYTDSIAPRLFAISSYPDYRQMVSAGVPADLLRNRPDIIAAERQLQACAANIGVARKDFLPSLTLEGTVGTAAGRLDGLFHGGSLTYSVTPTLSWTLFDGLKRNYLLAQAKLEMESAIDSYNLTVMTAVNEVDNAIAQYAAAVRTIEASQMALINSRQATTISINQYRDGLSSFTSVADAQISWLQISNAMVGARASALQSLINLYKALGGSTL